ncbi:MAG TPA: hypothetical protein VGM13_10770 [Thermoanaerobaculia bacterium]
MRANAFALAFCVAVCGPLSAQEPAWEEIGPFSVGGRVSALAVDARDPKLILAGTLAGGIWRSANGGQTWAPVALWLSSTPISALAIDPTDSKTIVAGTGSLSDAGLGNAAIGVIKSTDGGVSWVAPELAGPLAYVSAAFHWPGDSNRVLLGTDLGVRLSTDGGVRYRDVLVGTSVSALVVDPTTPDTVLASTHSGLYRSGDRGESWSRAGSWPLARADSFGAGTSALALSGRTRGLLWAVVQVLRGVGSTDRTLLLRSADGGATFTTLDGPPLLCALDTGCGFGLSIAVDPTDDSRLLLGGDRLWSTSDGGTTWGAVEGDVAGPHQITPRADRVLVAGRSGVAVLDAGWKRATAQNDGLAITTIRSLDVTPGVPPLIAAGTADRGVLLGAGDGTSWKVAFGAGESAGSVRFAPFDSSRIYASKGAGQLFRSENGGGTFAPIMTGLDMSQAAAREAPIEPSRVDGSRDNTVYSGRLQLFRSTNAGTLWKPFRPPGFPEITRIAPSPTSPGRVYFALASDPVLLKADGIFTDRLRITDDPDLAVTSIFPAPDAENVLYVTLASGADSSGRVFKSYDFGQTWQDISPRSRPGARSVVRDSYGTLYLGAVDGVWRSANDGATWNPFRSGFFAGGVSEIRLSDGWLYAGTDGRGVFRISSEPLVSIDTVPPGLQILVDGQLVTSPFFARWDPGSVHTVSAVLGSNADTIQEFVGWSDGGATSHSLTLGDRNGWLTAVIRQSHRLRTSASGADGSLVLEPPSSSGFYVDGTFVKALAVPADDARFAGFTGDTSGGTGGLEYVLMSRPRSLAARFEPLAVRFATEPAGLPTSVDGTPLSGPATFRWQNGSRHRLSAPELVGENPTDPKRFAFDGWSDLRAREHTMTALRDTFQTDVVARFIPTRLWTSVPARGSAALGTPGTADAPRFAALRVTGDAGAPAALQVITGALDTGIVTELVAVPASAAMLSSAFVEDGGERGRTRLAIFNPDAAPATFGVVLRDPSGAPLASVDGLSIGPGAHLLSDLADLVPLPNRFEALLTLIADRPLVGSIQSVRANPRPSTFLDPTLVLPFGAADRGVPADPKVQSLLLTPDTEHRLALANTGGVPISGSWTLLDEAGNPLTATFQDGSRSSGTWSIPPGGYVLLRFQVPPGDGAGAAPRTAQIRISRSAGSGAPLVQLVESQTVGTAGSVPLLLSRSVPPSRTTARFAVPFDPVQRDSGFVLTNRGGDLVDVTFTLRDAAGTAGPAAGVTVPAGGQRAVSAKDLFPGAAGSPGTLEGVAARDVDAVGFFRRASGRGEDLLSAFPVLDAASSAGGDVAVFPFATDGDSWRSTWWFVNFGAGPVVGRLDFRNSGGESAYFPLP